VALNVLKSLSVPPETVISSNVKSVVVSLVSKVMLNSLSLVVDVLAISLIPLLAVIETAGPVLSYVQEN
jgi:hypothetical protein